MSERPGKGSLVKRQGGLAGYSTALVEIVELLEDARRLASHSVNTIMTSAYRETGRRIVEIERKGKGRADYSEQVIDRLSEDLTARLGRGFGRRNLFQMRAFYLTYREIVQTPSAQSEGAPGPDTTPRQGLKSLPRLPDDRLRQAFPLSWSHYVKLLAVKNPKAREFYEAEALWRRLDDQAVEPADQLAVLRARRALAEQGRDAAQGRGAARGRRGDAGGRD